MRFPGPNGWRLRLPVLLHARPCYPCLSGAANQLLGKFLAQEAPRPSESYCNHSTELSFGGGGLADAVAMPLNIKDWIWRSPGSSLTRGGTPAGVSQIPGLSAARSRSFPQTHGTDARPGHETLCVHASNGDVRACSSEPPVAVTCLQPVWMKCNLPESESRCIPRRRNRESSPQSQGPS